MANTFVLVHGAWQASYVWHQVKQELESKGQKVIVAELPAHARSFFQQLSDRDELLSAIGNLAFVYQRNGCWLQPKNFVCSR